MVGSGDPNKVWTGPRIGQLSEALLDAFDYDEFTELLLYRLDKEIESLGASYPKVMLDVLRRAKRQNWIDQLVVAATQSNPGDASLARLSQQLGVGTDGDTLAPERLVNAIGGFHDAAIWWGMLGKTMGRVCRVSVPTTRGTAIGTGFLIAPDVVLTNYHVVEPVADAAARIGRGESSGDPADIRCLFDYRRSADGSITEEGVPYPLADGPGWLIDFSGMSPTDSQPDPKQGLPTMDELDHALLRLATRAGDEPLGSRSEPGARKRGWIRVPADPIQVAPGATLLILQHPAGRPIKLEYEGKVIGLNENSTRIRYSNNTEGGSSGSPCFNGDWALVALHHAGDPDFDVGHKATYNEGIPIGVIHARLARRGLVDELVAPPD